MRSKFLTCILIFLGVNLIAQERGTKSKDQCSSTNVTFTTMGTQNPLRPFIVDEDRSGVIELHPFSISEIGGWQNLISAIKTDSNISFILKGKVTSRLFKGVYYRYQQLYKGVPVEDGGFTILVHPNDSLDGIAPPCLGCPGPVGPCDRISMIAPNIYEGISLSVTPNIVNVDGAVKTALQTNNIRIDTTKLRVVNNLNRDCAYKLAYQVFYNDSIKGERIAWMDANTGVIYYDATQHNNKSAPTADFGSQNMEDQMTGQNTVLRNGHLTAHNMEDVLTWHNPLFGDQPVTGTNQLGDSFDDNQIPTSPIANSDWFVQDASEEIFQAFWMADQILSQYQTQFGVVFDNVHIGIHPTAFGATSFGPAHPNDRANFVFGQIDGSSVVEFDVIAHEFAHTMIREFISSSQIEGGALHEGIADMFGTFMESILDPNGLDWVMGDDIPFVVRDLENTTLDCYDEVVGILDDPHDRSEALGHWFYLCVNGDPANHIPAMDIKEVLLLVLEAMPNLGDNPDYPDLMRAVLDLTESLYGTCSDQFLTILRSWEEICVPTNHRMADPKVPCAILTGDQSSLFPCEESNHFTVCLSSNTGINTLYGTWAIIGRNSVNFHSVRGMVGNSQSGGDCLEIDQIPTMPFYPQTLTIQYWHSSIGQTITIKIVIRDCDGDDPTCEDYYDLDNYAIPTEVVEYDDALHLGVMQVSSDSIKSHVAKTVVFDLLGKMIEIFDGQVENFTFDTPQIVVVTYWNEVGELIQSKRIFLR